MSCGMAMGARRHKRVINIIGVVEDRSSWHKHASHFL